MTEQQRKERDFFAQKISKKLVWSEDDTMKMLDLLDPVWNGMTPQEEAKHLSRRLLDFMKEFTEWEAKQPKPEQKPAPMTDEEIESLAGMF